MKSKPSFPFVYIILFISIVFLLSIIPDALSSPRGGREGALLSSPRGGWEGAI